MTLVQQLAVERGEFEVPEAYRGALQGPDTSPHDLSIARSYFKRTLISIPNPTASPNKMPIALPSLPCFGLLEL